MSVIMKDVKVTMSRIGITSANVQHHVAYMPMVTITYVDPKRKRLRGCIQGRIGRFKKSDYLEVVLCGEFFVAIFKTEWCIISPECQLLASMSPCGQIIAVAEDHFIVRTGETITGYDCEGKSVGSRKLTSEELQELNQ